MGSYIDMMVNYINEYSIKVVAAIAIFIIGKWLTHKLTYLSKKLMLRAKIDQTLVEFFESIIYFVLLVVVILTSLNALGVNTTSFLAVFGAASLAVGLALKDSLSNIGAAVIIILFRPFKVGDTIEAGGAMGTVEDINLFSTVIVPVDKSRIIVPNSAIISGNITNFSLRDVRRVDHLVGIGYGDDLKKAKEILNTIIAQDERVMQDPAPLVAVAELGSSSVNLAFRVWVKADLYWDVYFETLEKIKLEFDAQGISIPFPQMDVHINKIESSK
ncbi:MAG: mechanosensitive ion channel [Epsilonproteobacteria bacterium]|nr:mechanosensitive ion channel [Campylobacterota bacterium]